MFAGAALALAALSVLVSAGRVAWLAAGRSYDVASVPERAVGMVLGAKADPWGPSAFLASRLDVAIQLFEAGKIRAILVSGDGLPRSNNEPAVMKAYLVERGVPASKVVEDPAGFDTYDSCVRARDVFGVTEMTVISQDYHLPRAMAICREVGVDAVGVADTTMKSRFPGLWVKGWSREWAANLKMEWDVVTKRQPQQDPPTSELTDAATVGS